MIRKGLLQYLYGPGTNGEHHAPHIVAGFEEAVDLEPVLGRDGRRDFRHFGASADTAAGVARDRNYRKPIWHRAVWAAPEDRKHSADIPCTPWARQARKNGHLERDRDFVEDRDLGRSPW